MSSYIEAMGNTQDVATDDDVVFDNDEDVLDIAGYGIVLSEDGKTFTITRTGLYHVEWSLNLTNVQQPCAVGLLENGSPTSALTTTASEGNISSGALINVTVADLPLTLSLHNFGAPLHLQNPEVFENIAASIRILRFADGESER